MKHLSFLFLSLALFASCVKVDDTNGADETNPYDGLRELAFTESDKVIVNPERGFLSHLEFKGAVPSVLSATTLDNNYTQGRSLLFTIYYLTNFMDGDISEAYLEGLRTNMRNLRAGGQKTVLRFAYKNDYRESDHPWDAPVDIVLRHVEQLKPILREFSDVIFLLEAGFVGSWGEWYYTDNFGFEPKTQDDYLPRRRLLEAELEAMPATRQVAVRYPAAKMSMYGWTAADSLTVDTAHDGSIKSRIAAHNDCFVSGPNDVGTYDKMTNDRNYLYAESRYLIMGGETCAVNQYNDPDIARPRIKKHHLTYLNTNYHQQVISKWRTTGFYKELEMYMGYRLVVDKAYVTPSPKAGETMRAVVLMRNVGYSAPQNPRDVYFVVSNGSKEFKYKVNVDPRTWYENTTNTIDCEFTLPSDLPSGKYNLYISLPDPEPTISADPRFAIQLANKDVWEAAKGWNLLTSINL